MNKPATKPANAQKSMEDSLLGIFGDEIYQICGGKTVAKLDHKLTGEDQELMNRCFDRFLDAYKITSRAFTEHLRTNPRKKEFIPREAPQS